MARTPLFPRTGDLTGWAHATTQRIERDFAFLRPKTGTFTLSTTVSTGVIDVNMTTLSRIFLTPITAKAAAVVSAGMWVSTKAAGRFVVTTAAAGSHSSVFDYVILPPPEV